MEIKVDKGKTRTASLKHVYIVIGYNEYTGGPVVYGAYDSHRKAVECIEADIEKSTHPNLDNGWSPPWLPEDIVRKNDDTWLAGDEYVWEIVNREVEQ